MKVSIASVAKCRNITDATVAGLRDIKSLGVPIEVRGQEVREIVNRITVLDSPQERCLFLPGRRNNIFACIAETMWVLAGRDDIAWLSSYLPRAGEFSDDGVTWRGGYGPRLRAWSGIDQLDEVRKLLLSDPHSRRAVMNLFDPARDYATSKDIPCNNWLHWLVRDGRLLLNVAVRSNDAIWGFSGINAFEWSVLQEMMAWWTGTLIGPATYFASSFHLYQRHYTRAAEILDDYGGACCYGQGVPTVPFRTPWEDFRQVLGAWFDLESRAREAPHSPIHALPSLGDPFLAQTVELLRLYRGFKSGWEVERLQAELEALSPSDLVAAAYEHFGRTHPGLIANMRHSVMRAFIEQLNGGKPAERLDLAALKGTIKRLHAEKDAAYGPSWKRRGELTSILANIARKADRLEVFVAQGTLLADESTFDTAIDLFVYCQKYRLFLLEQIPDQAAALLPADAPWPFSDAVSNFDVLVDAAVVPTSTVTTLPEVVGLIQTTLAALHQSASDHGEAKLRLELASSLTDLAALALALTYTLGRLSSRDEKSIARPKEQHGS